MVTSPKRSPFLIRVGLRSLIVAGLLSYPIAVSAQGGEQRLQRQGANAAKIWEDRGPVDRLNLYWANGSPERVPVGPFTFVSEDLGGTNPKANVRDVNGVLWGVKWDEEVHAELAASRLAWAMGLRVDETYYVGTGKILFPRGQRPALQRIAEYIDRNGTLRGPARFKRWITEYTSKGEWPLGDNPMKAESGYAVLLMMDVVMANWDAKDSNTRILSVPGETGATDWYMVGDYGACFGKMGGTTSHSKYRLNDFLVNPPVIKSVSGDTVYLAYRGRNGEAHASVPLAGAQFFADIAGNLTLAQVEDAFRAANAKDAELHGFAQAVYARIRDVVAAVRSATAPTAH
ncbi:MAG: hypothetical protein ABI665_07560 [Vicinamibacterales bacterium]